MKNRNRKSPLITGIILFSVGGIFIAFGVAFLAITLKGLVEVGMSEIGFGIFLPILFILAFFGFGITALIMGGKQIYLRIRQSRAEVCGKAMIAKIVGHKTASMGKGHNLRIRYALVLACYDDGEQKTFTTDYLYDVNEYRYLNGLSGINIKVDGNFATVCEAFPKDIYKIDSTYGIETAFFKQKPVAILFRLWMIFFIAAMIFLIASFFIQNSAVTMAAIVIVFAVHFPFVIPLAIYLIKWIHRKK